MPKYVYTLRRKGAISTSTIEVESPLDVHDAVMEQHGIKLDVTRSSMEDGPRPKIVVARFDATGLSDDELDGLIGEITCQAETSDAHPGLPAARVEVVEL